MGRWYIVQLVEVMKGHQGVTIVFLNLCILTNLHCLWLEVVLLGQFQFDPMWWLPFNCNTGFLNLGYSESAQWVCRLNDIMWSSSLNF